MNQTLLRMQTVTENSEALPYLFLDISIALCASHNNPLAKKATLNLSATLLKRDRCTLGIHPTSQSPHSLNKSSLDIMHSALWAIVVTKLSPSFADTYTLAW